MNKWSIQARVMTLALVPLLMAVVALSVVYTVARVADIEQSLNDKGRAIANQLALTYEYGVYTRNQVLLTALASAALREKELISIAIDGENNIPLVSLAEANSSPEASIYFSQDIYFSDIVQYVDFSEEAIFNTAYRGDKSHKIGRITLGLSTQSVVQQQRDVIIASIMVSIVLLLGSLLVAVYISRSITYPIVKLTRAVSRIGDGRLDCRVEVFSGGELGELEVGISTMVANLEEAEKENQQRYQALFNFSGDAVFLVFDGLIVDCNSQASRMLGLGYGELAGRKLTDFLLCESDNANELMQVLDQRSQQHQHGDTARYEVRFEDDHLGLIDAELCIVPTEMYKQKHLLVLARDISERKKIQERLERQANYDALTGLPNRTLVQDRLVQSIKSAQCDNRLVGLMFIDIDRFKNVNDTMGHAAGDVLLIEIANRLMLVVREVDTVARLGGDEFLIVMGDISSIKEAEQLAKNVIQEMNEPFVLEGKEFYLGASIGISIYPNDGDDHHVLMRHADAAMYRAKHEGRNTYRFFTSEIVNQAGLYLEMESHLRRVISRGELAVDYQPQIDIKSKTLVGAEALLRWRSPVLGDVDLERFIPVAEESGLIVDIGAWVLEQVCIDLNEWSKKGLPPIRIAVNISTRQIKEATFVERVEAIVRAHNVSPDLLELEITESLLLEDEVMSSKILEKLKQLGFRLSLDDFGTGYSSLSYLKHYPFDALKIDKAFVRDINHNSENAALSNAIVAIGTSLGMDVVGEGVEEEAQLNTLRAQGANIAQGFYISVPLKKEAFEDYLRTANVA